MIVALAFGVPPSVVDSWSAKDVAEIRWFYARHPFGDLRGDLQAWLGGVTAAMNSWGKKPVTMDQAMKMFQFSPPSRNERRRDKRTRERRPRPSPITGEMLRTIALSHGAIEVKRKD